MSSYRGASRTNYFQVKDEAAFRAWAAKWKLKVIENDGLVGLLPSEASDEGVFFLFDEKLDDSRDICDEIAGHLADGSVAIVVEAGAQKLCYIGGWAVAINSQGERAQVSLDDIYALAAAKFGVTPTFARS